jgi:hypothetical protein
MKLKKFLNEGKDISETVNIIAEYIKKDCKKYIKEVVKSNEIIYRGIFSGIPTNAKRIEDGLLKVKSRVNREPSDTPEELHNYVNTQFKKKFGWNVRSEGVFTAKNKRIANNYGVPHAFFPIGDYKYVYSNKAGDLYTHFEDGADFNMYILKDKEKIKKHFINYSFKQKYEREYDEFSGKGEYIFRDKPTGEKEYYKAMLVIKRKYPEMTKEGIEEELVWEPNISFDMYLDEYIEKSRRHLYRNVEHIIDTYKTSNITQADKDTEIVFKCKEYYLVDDEYITKLMFQLLKG